MYGDQYVTVQIEVPKNLNAQAKEKLKDVNPNLMLGDKANKN